MNMQDQQTAVDAIAQARLDRRKFLTQAGLFSAGIAATGLALGSTSTAEAQSAPVAADTLMEIFTAVLIAEDLATTFYYNVLVGPVIQDPMLAGPNGTATNVTSGGNFGNVQYIRAALSEEIVHADLARILLGGSSPKTDPSQTFYFPPSTFSNLMDFTNTLAALENAFIGAYLTAIQEISLIAAQAGPNGSVNGGNGTMYPAQQLAYFIKVAASIMGVECEHRALGRVISNTNPANNLNFEQIDGLDTVYNGPKSAVVALTPFLTPSNGSPYTLAAALAGQGAVSLPVTDTPPPTYS